MAVNEKHIDLIQSVITRHNSNSFMIKGWTITIASAIFAIAGTLKEPILAIIPVIPIFIFWYLDAFYLANERCFVSLYNCSINNYKLIVKNKDLKQKKRIATIIGEQKSVDPEKDVELISSEFSMNHTVFKAISRNNICSTFWSVTIRWFYVMLIIFSISLFIGLIFLKNSETEKTIKISAKIENESLNIKSETPQTIINNIMLNDSLVNSDTTRQ